MLTDTVSVTLVYICVVLSVSSFCHVCASNFGPDLARGYKTFFILNSAEHEIYPVHKC